MNMLPERSSKAAFRRSHLFGLGTVLIFALALVSVAAPADSKTRSETPASVGWKLSFICDLNLPTGTSLDALGSAAYVQPGQTRDPSSVSREERLRRKVSGGFGSISGIAYDADTQLLYALSDSGKAVFFVFSFRFTDGQIKLGPGTNVLVIETNSQPVVQSTLDPEAIALTPDRTLLVASEGYTPRQDAAILETDLSGRVLKRFSIPDNYRASSNRDRVGGVRGNAGFEGLTLTPDHKHVFVATEDSLLQDGPAGAVGQSSVGRILEYARHGPDLTCVGEFAYRMDPMTLPPELPEAKGAIGVSEILALSDHELLVLERGFALDSATGKTARIVRIYHADLSGASNTLPAFALKDAGDYRLPRKTLLLDLADVVHRFTPPYQSLDNFEGMCFGPTLPDGSRSIILVSDDNYREEQRTAIVLLRLQWSPL